MEIEKDEEDLLVPVGQYLSSGVHIGTHQKKKEMEQFVYESRPDGLFVLDINKTDNRLKTAGKFLARFEPEDILIVTSRLYGRKAAETMSEALRARTITDRFVPGTLTNPRIEEYIEPEVVFVIGPETDNQAIKESGRAGIPVISIVDTNSSIKDIDLAIPANNKGRESISLVYWILTREVLESRGEIDSPEEYKYEVEDFEADITEEEVEDLE